MPDYIREVKYQDEHCEIVMITWPPGSRSKRHDHGVSDGIVRVLEGSVYEERDGKRWNHDQGAKITETPGMIHVMGNDSDHEARTHHVYTPKLTMNFYDES